MNLLKKKRQQKHKIKNYLQKTAILLFGITLLFSCNKDGEPGVENCNYEFVDAIVINNIVQVGATEDVLFSITKESEICDTEYTMSYVVKRNDVISPEGKFIYNGEGQEHDTDFAIEAANFTGGFTVTNLAGSYEIIFTITNVDSAKPVQTKSVFITFNQIPIIIQTGAQTNVVYAKQTATYNYGLTGGGNSGSYQIKITPNGATLASVLKVNGTQVNFGTFITVANNFNFTLTPDEVGNNAAFTITAKKNEVIKTTTFDLTSKTPRFTIQATLLHTSTTSVGKLRVNITMLDGYDQNLTYNYTAFRTPDFSPREFFITNNIFGTPIPLQQNIIIDAIASSTTVQINVTNQYGYTASTNVGF